MIALKVVFLFLLALVAIPVGIFFSVMITFFECAEDMFLAIWRLIYGFFHSLSKVVSVMASKFLTGLLTKRGGVPFGAHSVSAVLGANLREKTLSKVGIWLAGILDSIEENHCTRAAERAGI
jgi:hypothetical protein